MKRPHLACLLSLALALPVLPAVAEDPVLPGPPPIPPPPPGPAPVVVAPDLRPRTYVTGLDDLAGRVKEDAAIEARVRALETRQTTALAVGGTIAAAGLIVTLTGLGNQSCHEEPSPLGGSFQVCEAAPGQALAGMGITAAGGLAMALLWPGPRDLLDVINAWNTSHPDRPFELAGVGHHVMVQQVATPAP